MSISLSSANEKQLKASAEAAMASKDWARAAQDWRAILELNEAKAAATVFVRLARAQRMVKDIGEAAKTATIGLERYPNHAALLREAAEIEMALGNWARAAEFWDRAIAIDSSGARVGYYRRWLTALQNSGAFQAARGVLETVLARFPGDPNLSNDSFDLEFEQRRKTLLADGPAVMPEKLSIKQICDCFWMMEEKFSLLSWRIGDVAPWMLLRMQLYYSVTQQAGLYDPPHPALNRSRKKNGDNATSTFEAYWNALDASPSGSASPNTISRRWNGRDKPYDAAILMATKKINGTEPYTDAIRTELGERALLLDSAPDGMLIPGAIDFNVMKSYFRTRYRQSEIMRLPNEANMVCEAIWRTLFETLGVDIGNLAKICRQQLVNFIALRTGFSKFFAHNPVRTLYLTNSYGHAVRAALVGARAHGARIVELQHGIISPYHLGYSWPGRPEVPDCPDELWCFGEFWPNSTPLPAGMTHRVIGAPYVRALAEAMRGQRDENLVVFTSQGVIGRKLFDLALQTSLRRKDKRIVFRLHPNESLEDYEALIKRADRLPDNFSVSHKTPNIFALLAMAGIQVGAFSTTLFEGMSLGTRTVVVDIAGSEYMHPVVTRGDALMVNGVDELVAKLDQAPYCSDPAYYYAKPPAHLL